MSTFHNQIFDISDSSKLSENTRFNADKSASSSEGSTKKILNAPIATTVEEQLWDNRAALKMIASKYSVSHIDAEIKAQLFAQIDWLLNYDQWEEGDKLADGKSFKTLVKFILNTKVIKAPYLGLSNNGNILASWVNESGKLVLECLPNEITRYTASIVVGGRKKRAAGDAETVEDLLDLLHPFKNSGLFD